MTVAYHPRATAPRWAARTPPVTFASQTRRRHCHQARLQIPVRPATTPCSRKAIVASCPVACTASAPSARTMDRVRCRRTHPRCHHRRDCHRRRHHHRHHRHRRHHHHRHRRHRRHRRHLRSRVLDHPRCRLHFQNHRQNGSGMQVQGSRERPPWPSCAAFAADADSRRPASSRGCECVILCCFLMWLIRFTTRHSTAAMQASARILAMQWLPSSPLPS